MECVRISIDLAWNAAWYHVTARTIAKREGKAGRVREHWAKLPASYELVDDRADIAGEHLVLPEGQLIQTINNDLLFPYKTVASLHSRLAPGGIAACPTRPTLPRIVSVERKSMRELLGKGDLKCVEVRVEIIAVVLNAVRPAALASSKERIGWWIVSRVSACW